MNIAEMNEIIKNSPSANKAGNAIYNMLSEGRLNLNYSENAEIPVGMTQYSTDNTYSNNERSFLKTRKSMLALAKALRESDGILTGISGISNDLIEGSWIGVTIFVKPDKKTVFEHFSGVKLDTPPQLVQSSAFHFGGDCDDFF